MNTRSIYLCGPINGRSDADSKTWRELATFLWSGACIDPIRRDYRGREMEPGIAAEIVAGDLADIQKADAMLVFFDKPSVGTAMELFYAKAVLGKPCVVIFAAEGQPSPWLKHHCDAMVSTVGEALEVLGSFLPEVKPVDLAAELGNAYRCIQGMHHAMQNNNPFSAEGYHALTIAAAKRFVFENMLDGSGYFIGKPVSVVQAALALPQEPQATDQAVGAGRADFRKGGHESQIMVSPVALADPILEHADPIPEHADHVSAIAARLRRLARIAGVAEQVPEDDALAVGAILSVLGNMSRALERKMTTAIPPGLTGMAGTPGY